MRNAAEHVANSKCPDHAQKYFFFPVAYPIGKTNPENFCFQITLYPDHKYF
jgi:hypothetical protein